MPHLSVTTGRVTKHRTIKSDCTPVTASSWSYHTLVYLPIATSQPNPFLLNLAKWHRTSSVLMMFLSRAGFHKCQCHHHNKKKKKGNKAHGLNPKRDPKNHTSQYWISHSIPNLSAEGRRTVGWHPPGPGCLVKVTSPQTGPNEGPKCIYWCV